MLLEGEMLNTVLNETGSILQLSKLQDSISCKQNNPENLASIENKIWAITEACICLPPFYTVLQESWSTFFCFSFRHNKTSKSEGERMNTLEGVIPKQRFYKNKYEYLLYLNRMWVIHKMLEKCWSE